MARVVSGISKGRIEIQMFPGSQLANGPNSFIYETVVELKLQPFNWRWR